MGYRVTMAVVSYSHSPALALTTMLVVMSTPASADGARTEAMKLLRDASRLFTEHRCEEALPKLERSYDLVPSPNSMLMIARCSSELGQHVEAYERYTTTLDLASTNERYARTAQSAATEQQALRDQLTIVKVRLVDAPPGTTVRIAGAQTPLDGDVARRVAAPGRIAVEVSAPSRADLTRELTGRAGSELFIELTVPEETIDPGPEPTPTAADASSGSDWALYGAIAGGVMGLVGMGMFVGFGVSNQQAYADLEERCAPNCGSDFTDDIVAGERDGLIANISLGVGLVGLATGTAMLVVYLVDDDASLETAMDGLRVRF